MSDTILSLIKDDHDKHRGILGGISETSGDSPERRRLFDLLAQEMKAHAAAEEQTLYAALIKSPEAQEQGRHSIVEHAEAEDLLAELEEMDMGEGAWLQKFAKLRHALEHHMEEEERDVFPLAEKLLSEDTAKSLGARFDQRKSAEAKEAA